MRTSSLVTAIGPFEAIAAGFAAGLASLPHCALMCGPLATVACARSGHPRAHVGYQSGRVIGYAFAGSLAGHFGLFLTDAVPFAGGHRLLAVLTSLALVMLAVRVAGLGSGRFSTLRLRGRRSAESTLGARALRLLPRSATVLGGASTMLPCGALAAALLIATGMANAGLAALLMATFAVATAPALWASTGLNRLLLRVRSVTARSVLAAALLATAAVVLIPSFKSTPEGADAASAPACH